METWIKDALEENSLYTEAGLKENILGILLSLMSTMPVDKAVAEAARRTGAPVSQVQQMANDPSIQANPVTKSRVSNFSDREFACKCCGVSKVDPALVAALEKLRSLCGNKPVVINSAYRCPRHNAAVGGAKNSQHVLGTAADITIKGMSPSEVARIAQESGLFNGIGRYATFTHVDLGPRRQWNG